MSADDPAAIFQSGLADHQAGRFPEAEAAYRRVLELSPEHPDTLHLYGLLAHQCGHNGPAIELIERALARLPERPDFLSNLGLVLNAEGRSEEAEATLLKALAREPNYPDALNNLGIALFNQGRSAEAATRYRAALAIQPRYPEALNNLGRTQAAQGDHRGAEESYRQAIAVSPGMADAHGNLGLALYAQGRLEDAEACYRQALRVRPGYWDALNNLGVLLSDAGRLEEAEGPLREAIALRPDKADAYANLGTVLTSLSRPAEAEAILRRALAMAPAVAEAHMNLGAALHGQGQSAEAEAAYREALRHDPGLADAHANLAYALLLAGRLEEAWPEYEWRWQTKHMLAGQRGFTAPQWRGEPLEGRTLLVHAEQGLGDTLQFCRYVPMIHGGRVILEVQGPLKRIAEGLPGVERVFAQGDALPHFDLHCPLLSLPLAFGTTLDSIPARIPYLHADPAEIEVWRERLAPFSGLKVGLVWAGSRRTGFADLAAVDRRRSISLATLAPLAGVPGVDFLSLQKDGPGGEAADPPAGMALTDFTAELRDFADTAAFIEALDMVICVDTSVAHMAGALGKPVWLLNRFDNCWRWLIGRDDSPWYPSLRQFRQPAPGDWASVVTEVREALAAAA